MHNGSGMTIYHYSAQGPAYYWLNESWGGAGGGGTAMNRSTDMAMTPQDVFRIIQTTAVV